MPTNRIRNFCVWFNRTRKRVDGPLGLTILAGTFMYAGAILKDRIGSQATINELLASQHESNNNIANLTTVVNRMSADQHQILQAITPVVKTVNEIKSAQSANLESIKSDTVKAVKEAASQAVAIDKTKR